MSSTENSDLGSDEGDSSGGSPNSSSGTEDDRSDNNDKANSSLSKETNMNSEILLLDLISTLPDPILLHILSFVKIEEMIATSVLSKRWLYLWTASPILKFFKDYETYRDDVDFVNFVNQTLVLCGGEKIKRLEVDFGYDSSFDSSIDIWIRFAARNKAEELALYLYRSRCNPGSKHHYELPQHYFGNTDVTKISLSLCYLKPKGMITWKSLRSLSLGYLKLSNDLVNKIVLGCPVMTYFDLYEFFGIDCIKLTDAAVRKLVITTYWGMNFKAGKNTGPGTVLEIRGPSLHSLKIMGSFGLNKCRLVNLNSLVEANLSFNCVGSEGWDEMLKEMLGELKHVENIRMGTWCNELSEK
ncbi:hypothetical protein LguiB_034119 [Lonicera macranthoides]